MRRQSNSPQKKAQREADRALQDSYRLHYPDEKCECCGEPFDLMHHHVEKSKSNYMRYACPANLIFLCAKCHSALHFDNFNVASIYSLKRGKQWEAEIMDIKRQPSMTIGVNRFEEITYYYENNIPEKWELEPTK